MTQAITIKAQDAAIKDGYQNFAASIGLGTDNLSSFGTYAFSFITRNRILLEAMYRGSWVIGAAVDMLADDMTQGGIEVHSQEAPDKIEELTEYLETMRIWQCLNSAIKWSRLYGSSVGVYLIDGQDFSTPLRLETVGKGQFKGILPLDRWQLVPSIGRLVKSFGPDIGKPEFYTVLQDSFTPNLGNVHYTRLFRLDSIELPHYQKMTENLWAESIVERIFDRLEAFDSTTQGAAQLVFKSYLRTWKVNQLREVLSAGGVAADNLVRNVQQIRRFQGMEGLTMIDKEDEFETHSYTFAGLDDVLMQFGQQLAGALEIPLVRLFGTSPKGMNATGESDLRTYHDSIRRKQKMQLRAPVKTIIALAYQSLFGKAMPVGTSFEFCQLWQLTDKERSDMAYQDTQAAVAAVDAGLVPRHVALKELRQNSKANGMWSNIDDAVIKDAESEPPLSEFKQTPEEIAAMAAAAEGAGNGEDETADNTGTK